MTIDRDMAIKLIDDRIRQSQATARKEDTILGEFVKSYYCMGLEHAKDIIKLRMLEVHDG